MLLGLRACALALLVACQQSEPGPEPAHRASMRASVTPTARHHRVGDHVNVHGLDVQFLDNGMISIHGGDRWGNPLDTTYENIEFLRDALSVLERSVTDEQAADLRALVAEQ